MSISEVSEIRSAKTLGKGEFKERPFSVVHIPSKGIGTSELCQGVQLCKGLQEKLDNAVA